MINTLELSHTDDCFSTEIKIDNSTNHKDMEIKQAIVGASLLTASTLTLQLDRDTLTINGVVLSDDLKGLIVKFITQTI